MAKLDKIDCEVLLKALSGSITGTFYQDMFNYIKQELEKAVKGNNDE